MNRLSFIALAVVLIFSIALLWSSNSFDQSKNDKPDNRLALAYNVVLPMTFAHAEHAEQKCGTCHHNYLDDTGQGLCLECHKTDPEISYKMHDHFHGLCMGCHTEKRSKGEDSGPLRNCRGCHTADHAP